MKKQKGTWKIWAVVAVLSAFIVAAMVEVNGRPVLNITKKGTKELIVVDAGHGGRRSRPKRTSKNLIPGAFRVRFFLYL